MLFFWHFYNKKCCLSTWDHVTLKTGLMVVIRGINNILLFYCITFTFIHLADAYPKRLTFQAIHLYCQYVCSLGIEPTTFALLTQCSNHWATGTLLLIIHTTITGNVLLIIHFHSFRSSLGKHKRLSKTWTKILPTPNCGCRTSLITQSFPRRLVVLTTYWRLDLEKVCSCVYVSQMRLRIKDHVGSKTYTTQMLKWKTYDSRFEMYSIG